MEPETAGEARQLRPGRHPFSVGRKGIMGDVRGKWEPLRAVQRRRREKEKESTVDACYFVIVTAWVWIGISRAV